MSKLEIPISELRREVRAKNASGVIACGQLKLLGGERYKEQACVHRLRLEEWFFLTWQNLGKV